MRVRAVVAVAGALLALTAMAGTAAAGGWAVTTLDPSTAVPVAGQSTLVGYTILQHGATPVSLDDTAIVVTPADGGAPQRFAGRPEGALGHHVAAVTFPAAGRFSWLVEQGWFGPQDLGTIEVAAAGGAAGPAAGGRDDAAPWALRIGLVVATVAAAAGLGWSLAGSRRRPAATLDAR